jgi:hypothetical protein
MKKTIGSMMAASLLLLLASSLMAKERRGAQILVAKNDGLLLSGELIAVRKDSLLLLAGGSLAGAVQSVPWEMMTKVTIVRKSRVLEDMAIGGLLLGGGGALLGYTSGDDPPGWFSFTAGQKAAFVGVTLGLVGLVAGGISGALAGVDKSLPVDTTSEAKLSIVQAKLAERARVKGIQ